VVGMGMDKQQPGNLGRHRPTISVPLAYSQPVSRRHLEYGCAVIVIGLLAGVAGAATTVLLHWIEHLTFHYSFGSLLEGVTDSSPVRRVLGPMVGGALA